MLLEYLSNELVLDKGYVDVIAKTAHRRYKRFDIPKASGDDRTIYHPSKELKVLQRVIHDDFLTKLPVHESASAYKKGSSPFKNASLHKDGNYFLRIDFQSFFESISKTDVVTFINRYRESGGFSWTHKDVSLFANLVCFNGGLSIGSVTSPVLANAICYDLDCKVYGYCQSIGVVYTRYSDDLYFSSVEAGRLFAVPSEIKSIIRSLECPSHLWINTSKTFHTSRKRQVKITGLVISNNREVSIGREQKRYIRSLVYSWDSISLEQKKYLAGYLSYCKSVEPSFINSLCKKYGAKKIMDIQKF